MKQCKHIKTDIKFGLEQVKTPHRATHVIRVQIICRTCGAKIRWLGLPAAFVPDAPHPGDDNTSVYLPAFWLDE